MGIPVQPSFCVFLHSSDLPVETDGLKTQMSQTVVSLVSIPNPAWRQVAHGA
jgi:hypothetical protein